MSTARKSKRKQRKESLTPQQKKSRRKRNWCIAICILMIIPLAFAIAFPVNAGVSANLIKLASQFDKVVYSEHEQLVPEQDADGYWTFTKDEDFKVLQLTDVHIGGGALSAKKDAWALNAVAAMITAEQPDLVVVTGDMAYPVPYSSGTFDNISGIKIFTKLMETLGVYWTFTFGNHDTEAYSFYSREKVEKYILEQNFKYCLYQKSSENVDGCGNHVIKVKNSAGLVTQALTMFDSHSYTDGDIIGILWKYDNIHKNQVEWYANEMAKINAANQAIDPSAPQVKNMMFFHIPLREYRTAWSEVLTYMEENNTKDLTKIYGVEITAKNNDKLTLVYGRNGEAIDEEGNPVQQLNPLAKGEETFGIYCGKGDDEVFEVGKENGCQAIFCGHDHLNNFSIMYNGIRLTYGMSIDYLAYPGIWQKQSQRGCTIINISPDGSFTCTPSNYYQAKYRLSNKDNQDEAANWSSLN